MSECAATYCATFRSERTASPVLLLCLNVLPRTVLLLCLNVLPRTVLLLGLNVLPRTELLLNLSVLPVLCCFYV